MLDRPEELRQAAQLNTRSVTVLALALGLIGTILAGSQAGAVEAVLAASWEPTFCRSPAGRDKRECLAQTADRYDAAHFSLHGLWPDNLADKTAYPCYCGRGAPVSCRESEAPDRDLRLSRALATKLRRVMPGSMSGLHLHEWTKHGTCYETAVDEVADPEDYFSDAIALVGMLNASVVGRLFAESIGERVTRAEIAEAFDTAFGEGAAERLTIVCTGRGRHAAIAELRINIAGDITPGSDLGELILAAPTTATSTNDRSCEGGLVTAVD